MYLNTHESSVTSAGRLGDIMSSFRTESVDSKDHFTHTHFTHTDSVVILVNKYLNRKPNISSCTFGI